ncbi:MAG: hypothetical protein R2729_17115 [Bryobacteraceae bacterium]
MKTRVQTSARQLIAAGCVLLLMAPAMQAHNKIVHQDMVDLAYMVMLGVKKGVIAPPPPSGVSQTEWTAFLNAIKAAPDKYRSADTGLPQPSQSGCVDDEQPPSVSLNWAQGPAGQIPYPVSVDFIVAYGCGRRAGYTPGGIFNGINAPANGPGIVIGGPRHRDYTGTVLGFWAASVDDGHDDTHLWSRPVNWAGQSNVWLFLNDVGSFGLGALFAPFVCIGALLSGDGDCAGAVKDSGEWLNLVDDLNGMLPGFGDWSGDDYTGVWHHIKMAGPASNDYDDHQGLLIEEAGPNGSVDPFDMVAMLGGDLAGISVNYEESNGPKRYEIENGGDFHQNTTTRSMGEWQFASVVHTAFEPVDNLAFYGWRRFRDSGHQIRDLAWPLHALGDASVPMHTAGTAAWGHRPYEDSFADSWRSFRYLDAGEIKQTEQAAAILARAFEFRQFIQQWRSLHASSDVPVRDLVTRLAQRTSDYAAQRQAASGWPFSATLSAEYALDSEAEAKTGYSGRGDHLSNNQPLIHDGAGATLAFLVSAAELM